MQDLLSAIALGFSFGNLWLCVLLVFTLQQTNRQTCAGYLIGRFLAILGFSMIIAIIGSYVKIDKKTLHLISGSLLLLISTYFLLTRVVNIGINFRFLSAKAPVLAVTNHDGCQHDCKSCPAVKADEYKSMCSSCDSSLCEAEQPEVEVLTRSSRTIWRKPSKMESRGGFVAGLSLGAVRGVALCNKMVVLVPMLLTASAAKAAVVSVGFGVSSPVYPLLGFFFGGLALKFVRFKKALFLLSCSVMILFGFRYLFIGLFR